MSNTTYTLKQYRAAIRLAWLKVVGRNQFKRYEYDLTGEWHTSGVPLTAVLRAIQAVKDAGTKVYSLGVLKADLAKLEREQASNQVGAATDDWRKTWAEELESLAMETSNPELSAMFRELRDQLPTLEKDEAIRRWKEIPS